jgi:hypothetical protein
MAGICKWGDRPYAHEFHNKGAFREHSWTKANPAVPLRPPSVPLRSSRPVEGWVTPPGHLTAQTLIRRLSADSKWRSDDSLFSTRESSFWARDLVSYGAALWDATLLENVKRRTGENGLFFKKFDSRKITVFPRKMPASRKHRDKIEREDQPW